MDLDRLAGSPIGRLVDITGTDPRFQRVYRTKAYLPDPLPRSPMLTARTHVAIARAAAGIGRADQAVLQLPNPTLLVRPSIRREAVSTSALEGTYAAFTDVLEADFLEEGELTSSVAEVRNFVRAAEAALKWVDEGRPITVHMLEQAQKILVRGTRADTPEAGHVRSNQVLIGLDSRPVEDARFIPSPPGDLLRDGVSAWQEWIQASHDLHPIAMAALAHYQFETLHPFNDGNGRIGRLVALLQLITAGELQSLIVNLSPWLKEREEQYQAHLFNINADGDFNQWVVFFCDALVAHTNEAVKRVAELLDMRQFLLDTARKARVRGVGLMLAGDLIGYPMVTARTVKDLYEVSPQAANNAVGRLAETGILRERTQRAYARIFGCDAVLAIIDRP
ncbi:MAG: Fic family protein [Streptosporangiaceae bacterium]